MKKIGFLILGFLFFQSGYSQHNALDSGLTIPLIGVSYAYQFAGGHMGQRFGNNSNVGGHFAVKLRSGIYIGFKANYLFGGKVKERGILDSIRTSEGGIIEYGGELTDPILSESGYSAFLLGGYVWPVFGPNVNSGILVTGGIGILQHHIMIDYRNADIPQLTKEYRRGYDRLSNGLALNEFIGYIHFGRKRLVNFFVGMDLTQAWTKNRRGINYDTRMADNNVYFDSLIGFRFGWMLTLYKRQPEEYYYN